MSAISVDGSTDVFIILHGFSMIKIKDYRSGSTKQVTIFLINEREIVFGQEYYFFWYLYR